LVRCHVNRMCHLACACPSHAHARTCTPLQEAWLSLQTKIHVENHTCHTRDHPAVPGCSPIKCARAVLDDFITHDECKLMAFII